METVTSRARHLSSRDPAQEASAACISTPFMFVKFAKGSGRAVTLPSAPPPSIIDDGDGMAHIAPNLPVGGKSLDAGLKRLIDAVLHR